jgi:hypothetical protein
MTTTENMKYRYIYNVQNFAVYYIKLHYVRIKYCGYEKEILNVVETGHEENRIP